MEAITNKRKMYELLAGGRLGNTIPQFFRLEDWLASPWLGRYPDWGVRCLVPGDPRMRLYVPTAEVEPYVRQSFPEGKGYNVSPMIDRWAVFKGEVMEPDSAPFGLYLYATTQGSGWREALRAHGQHYRGLAAQLMLQRYLDPASYEDVRELLRLYPGHVVEFSACSRPVGVIPGRNTCIWEVRRY